VVVRFLGSGYSAEVWEVRHLFLPASYALKLMHPEDLASEHKTSRFGAEASTLFRLRHPNLVRVHEANRTPEGLFFTVMELLEGETLAQKLAKGPIHPLRALKLAYDVACGLDEAHENGVIHRDVKPENIFVAVRGVAVLLDFVAAKFLREEDLRTTQPPDASGTLAYMAPEQFDGTADARSDVYALAMVLYRMLARRHPFEKSFNNKHRMMKDQFETIPEPFAEAIGLPAWIDDIVLRALEKPLDLRYQTAAAMAQVLHESFRSLERLYHDGVLLADVPLGEPPVDIDEKGGPPSRKQFVALEQAPHHTTGPAMPSQRITLSPPAAPSASAGAGAPGYDGAASDPKPQAPAEPREGCEPDDDAVTEPVSRAGAALPPTSLTRAAGPRSAGAVTTARVQRQAWTLAGLAPLAFVLAVPAASGVAWRWVTHTPAPEVPVITMDDPPARPAPAPSGVPPLPPVPLDTVAPRIAEEPALTATVAPLPVAPLPKAQTAVRRTTPTAPTAASPSEPPTTAASPSVAPAEPSSAPAESAAPAVSAAPAASAPPAASAASTSTATNRPLFVVEE
jgi:serine/threonine-protein kinase